MKAQVFITISLNAVLVLKVKYSLCRLASFSEYAVNVHKQQEQEAIYGDELTLGA